MSYDLATVQNWISHDPDPHTQAELRALLAAAEAGQEDAQQDLADRFQSLLQFGTAGLRGEMAGGPYRMNRAVVRKATAGLINWLQNRVGKDALVVVGFDARYNSATFAQDAVAIITAAGARAVLFPRELPTPILAHAVLTLGADAGIMVTASHNPPKDNGYKVYLGGRAIEENGIGVQIVPPVDKEIADAIAATPFADEIPLADSGWEIMPETVVENYIHHTAQAVSSTPARDLKIAYTAMHGVGYEVMAKVFAAAGFTQVYGVPCQIHPDPDFPTVSFPNPEEAGALDEAIKYAQEISADIIIASDPDADRASAAIPNPDGTWRQLSGDELGAILGQAVAAQAQANGKTGTLASSIVSSRILAPIAQHHGLNYTATLTGFKWIARVPEIIYGYEEAIGFCTNPSVVRDKDGISAGLVIATKAAQLKAAGVSLAQELDKLALQYGLYLTAPVTIRVEDLSIIPATMHKIRTCPPATLAGSPVESIVDLQAGTAELPPTDAVMIHTQANDRVIIRPSGTEPKVKCYLEVIVPVATENELPAAKETAKQRLEKFQADMRQALKL